MMSADENKPHDAKSSSLEERIKAFEGRQTERQAWVEKAHMPAEGMALAGRVAVELVAGLAMGSALGWALDNFFGTSPLWLVVLFFVGAVAGMVNVWRIATGRGMAAGYFDEHKEDDSSSDKDQTQ